MLINVLAATNGILGFIIILLFVHLNKNEALHRSERIDLYNRVMAKNYMEYANGNGVPSGRSPMRNKLEELRDEGIIE